jgi:HlyD family secretion protein
MKKSVIVVSLFFMGVVLVSCRNQSTNGKFKASGTIEATTVTLSSKTSGEVLQLKVREGSVVKKGEVLLVLDSTDYELQRQMILAQVALADAQLRLAEKGARQEDRSQAGKNVEAAKASLAQAQADFDRVSVLRKNESVPQKQLDDARTMLDVRTAQYEAAVQAHQKLTSGLRPEEIDIARAGKAQMEASLAIIDKKIRDCTIEAPLPATVTEKLVEVGETVNPGRDVLSLVDLSMVKLRVYVKEERLPLIVRDQPVQVRIDGSTKNFQGRVSYISDVAEFTPKTIQTEEERVKLVFAIEIEIDNPEGLLKSGMPADAIFEGSK